ncbi:MAG: HAD family phosphatase [Candidatus Latescibacterota bacterium]|jgi:putative hydrolase of the HAD superfamily
MTAQSQIDTLFLDIGGVLLTNGWDRQARHRAVERFNLDFDQIDERHHLTFDTYEEGKLSLDEYLGRIVFYEERPFTRKDFKAFMFAQSKPFPEMIAFISALKERYHLRTIAISNEGRELTEHRIRTFKLDSFVEAFISSCFVHLRKPDVDIFRLALDTAQARPDRVVYIDDRVMFVEEAASLGIHGIHHIDFMSTRQKLADEGLVVSDDVLAEHADRNTGR